MPNDETWIRHHSDALIAHMDDDPGERRGCADAYIRLAIEQGAKSRDGEVEGLRAEDSDKELVIKRLRYLSGKSFNLLLEAAELNVNENATDDQIKSLVDRTTALMNELGTDDWMVKEPATTKGGE